MCKWLFTYFKSQINTSLVAAITIGGGVAVAIAYSMKKR
jgi:hypothetical protein